MLERCEFFKLSKIPMAIVKSIDMYCSEICHNVKRCKNK